MSISIIERIKYLNPCMNAPELFLYAISCPNICDGEISVNPTNGIAPILYTLTGYPIQSAISWTGMCGDITFGTYTLDATDNNGCTASVSVTLIEPLPFVYTPGSAS